jgi:hypothetical protein
MTARYVDKTLLRKLGEEAGRRNYNRQLNMDAFDVIEDDEIFAISPIMIHEHAAGKPVEPHLRCSVRSVNAKRDLGWLMLDVPMELFAVLPEAKHTTADTTANS